MLTVISISSLREIKVDEAEIFVYLVPERKKKFTFNLIKKYQKKKIKKRKDSNLKEEIDQKKKKEKRLKGERNIKVKRKQKR